MPAACPAALLSRLSPEADSHPEAGRASRGVAGSHLPVGEAVVADDARKVRAGGAGVSVWSAAPRSSLIGEFLSLCGQAVHE